MRRRHLRFGVVIALLSTVCFTVPAMAQKGMGEPTGVAQQPVKLPIAVMAGTIKETKIAPCERTTGRSAEGVHLMVQTKDGQIINLHLGPKSALNQTVDRLSPGQDITFEAFRTDAMPKDAYVAKSLTVGGATIQLRDDSLRPQWAMGAQGGRGGGSGMGTGGRSGQGRGGGGACYW